MISLSRLLSFWLKWLYFFTAIFIIYSLINFLSAWVSGKSMQFFLTIPYRYNPQKNGTTTNWLQHNNCLKYNSNGGSIYYDDERLLKIGADRSIFLDSRVSSYVDFLSKDLNLFLGSFLGVLFAIYFPIHKFKKYFEKKTEYNWQKKSSTKVKD